MKKTLSMLLALVMVLAMIPLTAFAAEATVLVNVADQTVTDVAPYEYTWTVESAGTLTVEASGSPAWRYKIVYPDGSSTLDQKANQDWDLTATGTYTVQVYAYDNPGYTYTDGTVGLKLTFTPSEGGSEETPVEKAEYEVSSTKLALGDNTVSLLDTAVTTIYEFEPTEAATYTFTAPEGAIVGYWGAGSWFLQNPNSTTNTCEWTCSAVGQSAFVGVSGTEGSFNLNVAKTGEYVDTSIKYTQYENTHTPDEKYTACYTVGAVATETPVKGDDGFYYVGDKLAVVNFAASSISIAGMLGSGAAKYVEYNEDGTVKVAKDYTNALLAYTAVGNNYPMTDDLYEIIPNVVASKGWVESGYVTSWLDLVNTATVNHTAGEAVEEDGNTNTYCTVCGKLLSSEKIPATSVDIYYTGADVEVAAGKTVDCNLYFNGSMIMTVEGEGNFTVTYNDTAYAAVDGVVTIPGVSSSFWTPAVVQITNNSTADATYAVSFSLPVGSWSNPAALNTTDYNGNTATVAAGDQGYYFSWTAEGEGTLTLTVAYGVENWQLYVQNNTTYAQSETIYSPDDDVLEVEVAEGDEIVVVANTYNAADPYTVLAGEVVFDATYTAKQGTESNPYYIYDQDDTTAAVIDYAAVAPAGETTYYQGYGLPGTTLTFAAENVAVTVGGVALTAENGVYTYKIPASDNPRMPTVITITNNGTEDATYDLDFTYAIGTDVNPDLLPMGSDTVELAAGNSGYYYNWTAPCNGTLTVSVSGANWSYNINNTGDPESWADDVYGDYHYYYDDPVVATETWKVKTGDIVTVFVTTTDPDNWWSTPAGTVTVNASFKHNSVIHYDEVKPGCHYEGNIEYWYCTDCEGVWQDEACTQVTNHKNVVVPATGSDNVVHFEAVAPGCHYDGNIEYWVCYDCEQVWQDEALTQLTNIKNVVLPATGEGNVVHFEAVEPGCHYEGNIEYWNCTVCDQVWQDEALTQLTNHKNVVLPATGEGNVIHYDEVKPGCHHDGNIEYWNCTVCDQVWQDEALTQLTNHKNVVVPATGEGNVVHFDKVEPGCHYDGNIEYWVCYDCEQVWQDEALTQLTNIKNVVLPATGKGNVVHFDAVEPACHYDGNIEYWSCTVCDQVWQDEALTQLTNHKNVVLPATGGNVVHVDAVKPGCETEGNIEYWYCEKCEQVWQDEALTQLTNFKNVVLPATHQNVIHVDAVQPGCHYTGNIEYWYCADCQTVWQNEGQTQLTNFKNVILPATGEGNVVHFDRVEPGCHYEGNIEYWVCYDCEQVWQDEALTQLTNIKNVVLPATGGDVVHVDAVKPGCETTGNIEYWYCQKCEQVWQNEALTQLTNFKNVVVAAAGHDWDEGKVTKEATCTEKGEKTYTCEVCKATKTEEIAAKGHSYSSGKCLVCGAEDPDYKETTDNAQTGDESLIVMWTTVMILAAVAVVALVIKKRRMA